MIKKLLAKLLLVLVILNSVGLGMLLHNKTQKTEAFNPQAQEAVGLDAMSNFARLPYFKNGATAHQASSHDKTGYNDDWGNILYTDPITGNFVLLDVQSPGSVYRIWFTGLGGGNIKFYFDGEASPRVDLPVADFFSGATAPFLAPLVGNNLVSSGGYYSYLPMPFAESLKIMVTNAPNYYNINYDTFTTNTGVVTFTGAENSSTARTMWNNSMADPKSTTGNTTATDTISIGGSSTATLADISGRGSINSVKFRYPSTDAAILANIKIKMYWDGEVSPSVEVPFGEFFGNSMGTYDAEMHSVPVGRDTDGNYYCYFPMPYNKSARIVVDNQNASALNNFYYEIQSNSTAYVGLGNSAGYFKTQYKSENPTTLGVDYTILDLDNNSKGQYVGVIQTMHGALDRLYLEGDERVYVDGSKTPSIYGTGTEDYFNGGWYFQQDAVTPPSVPFSLPVHGNTVHKVAATDTTTAYRFFLSDAVPFDNSIKVGVEHGQYNDMPADYSSVAFYYALPSSGLTLSDTLDIGNVNTGPTSELGHNYTNSNQTWADTKQAYFYEGDKDWVDRDALGIDGNFEAIDDDGRSFTGNSQFTVSIDPANRGVKLRRRLDYSTANQKATVSVYNTGQSSWDQVGTWYDAGINEALMWRDSDFEIPESFTENKSSITVKITFVSSAVDWTEFTYWVYSYLDIDANPPASFDLLTPAHNSSTSDTTPTLSWDNTTDASSGLANYELYIDDVLDKTVSSVTTSTTPVTPLDAEPHTWYIKALDFAGNIRQSTSTYNINIDTSSPAAPILDSISTPTRYPNQTITGTKEANTAVWLNGEEIVPIDPETDWSAPLILTTGANALSITAKDGVGNESSAATALILYDSTPPQVYANVTGIQFANDWFSFTTWVNDPGESDGTGSGIASYLWQQMPYPGSLGTVSFSNQYTKTPTISASSEGTYALRLTVTDNAGNSSRSDTTFIWDTSGPTYSFSQAYDGMSTTLSSIIISGTASDGRGVSSTKINDITQSNPGSFSQSIKLKNGSNAITVVSTDNLGNLSSKILHITKATAKKLGTTANPADVISSDTLTLDSINDGDSDSAIFSNGNTPTIYTQRPTFRGKTVPNSTLTVTIHSNEEIAGRTTSNNDGTWSYALDKDLSFGAHTIKIEADTPDGKRLTSNTYNFLIARANAERPLNIPTPAEVANGMTTQTKILLGVLAMLALFIIMIINRQRHARI